MIGPTSPPSIERVSDILEAGLAEFGIPLSELQKQQFLTLARMLLQWNSERMNLTRLTSVEQIAVGHFLDSLAPAWLAKIPTDARVLDIGCGAGFPGLPLKILRPDIELTLLEATNKKLDFCRAAAEALGLARVGFVHGRAGEGSVLQGRKFDLVTARAVAPMARLLEMAASYLRAWSGALIAWKGPGVTGELADARETIMKHGLSVELKTLHLNMEGQSRTHCYVVCRWKDGKR